MNKGEQQSIVDINLIFSKIGGCLRDEQSDYAIRVVADLMNNFAHERSESLRNQIEQLTKEVDELKGKVDFIKSKGMTIGMMKTTDKPEPYLAYVIKEGSELCDNITLEKLLDAEIELLQSQAEVERLRVGIMDTVEGINYTSSFSLIQGRLNKLLTNL